MGDSSEQSGDGAKNNGAGNNNIVLGKYEMGRLLGKGSFAKVYYGKHMVTQESVAIKVINKEKVKKEGLMELIEREILVMRLVRHPNIVELKEVMATKGKIYMIMEYVRGGELFAKVVKGRLKEDSARNYFQQLVSAIDFCHSRGVYHRDLKLENLLLDENGNLKVSDFGLCAASSTEKLLLQTQCGTPYYVAPEVLRKKKLGGGYDGAKADIWSCGVILFVLLAGYLPFQDANLMNMYRKVFKADYKFPSWFSTESKRFISKILVVDPKRRISISTIMHSSWFCTNIATTLSIHQQQDEEEEEETVSEVVKSINSSSKPRFFNAFEFISSMSSGFDLSTMFAEEKSGSSMFTSKCSVNKIVEKLEWIAKKIKFDVVSVKDCQVKLQGKSEGRKGKVGVTAEIFEVAADELMVVELCKSGGDTIEYNKLFEQEVRPSLKDIVWSWQGDRSQ